MFSSNVRINQSYWAQIKILLTNYHTCKIDTINYELTSVDILICWDKQAKQDE